MMRDQTAFFLLLVVAFSLLWFVWPWSWLVGVFIAGLVFLWSLFFVSCVGLSRGFVVVFGLVAASLALAPLVEPFFLWYAVAPLAVFVALVYAAYRAYDSLLWASCLWWGRCGFT